MHLYVQIVINKCYTLVLTLIFLENFITELNELISSTKTLYYENLGKNEIIHHYKQKRIGQFLKLFIMTKKFL